MRDMMVNMEDTVESKTLEQLMRDPVWPAAVSTAAVALIPIESNQMISDQSRSRAFCTTLGQEHASSTSSGCAKRGYPSL